MLKRIGTWLATAAMMVVVGIVWVFAAVFVGGYLLVRRLLWPKEKWPRDEWLDDDR